jgi:type 1 glutamine amidotransferase
MDPRHPHPRARFAAMASLVAGLTGPVGHAGAQAPFKVFMIASKASDHIATSTAAKAGLEKIGADNGFTVDYTLDTSLISEENLGKYQVFFQEHLAPFEVSIPRRAALEKFVAGGKGWVGVHAAGLTQPDWSPKPYWQWYEDFFGGIKYVTHPALQTGTAIFEDRTHPVTRNMPATAQFKDEWYEWDGNPRPRVRVLAKADESTYKQVKPQGDHPIIWTNETFEKMIYIGIGHDVSVWSHPDYLKLVRDAVLWAKPVTTRLDPMAAEKGYLGTPAAGRAWIRDGAIHIGPEAARGASAREAASGSTDAIAILDLNGRTLSWKPAGGGFRALAR